MDKAVYKPEKKLFYSIPRLVLTSNSAASRKFHQKHLDNPRKPKIWSICERFCCNFAILQLEEWPHQIMLIFWKLILVCKLQTSHVINEMKWSLFSMRYHWFKYSLHIKFCESWGFKWAGLLAFPVFFTLCIQRQLYVRTAKGIHGSRVSVSLIINVWFSQE